MRDALVPANDAQPKHATAGKVSSDTLPLTLIKQALTEQRWERVRRMCLAALEGTPSSTELLKLLHLAYRAMGDIGRARQTVARIVPTNDPERLEVLLLEAEDTHMMAGNLGSDTHFRLSPEAAAGYTLDEYVAKYTKRIDELFAQARALARSASERTRLAAALRACRRTEQADVIAPADPVIKHTDGRVKPEGRVRQGLAPGVARGSVHGTIRDVDGAPVAGATVTLGLAVEVVELDPATYLLPEMHYYPVIKGPQEALTATTDTRGEYAFKEVPAGEHAFLAVTLADESVPMITQFVAHGVTVRPGEATALDALLTPWRSAPAVGWDSPFPQRLERDGVRFERVWQQFLRNPFYFTFPRQLLTVALPAGVGDGDELILLRDSRESASVPLQRVDGGVAFFDELEALGEHGLALYRADGGGGTSRTESAPASMWEAPTGREAVIDTGVARFRVPAGQAADGAAPLLAVQGVDRRWRGTGRLVLPQAARVRSRRTEVLEDGPILLRVRVGYALDDGKSFSFTLTAHRGEAYLLVHEVSTELVGARFELSFREFGGGRGRGYLHWKQGNQSIDWGTLESGDRELARLQESVPWWIPPAGFAYAMTPDSIQEEDFISVFTIRRGDWIDRRFEAISHGPGDEPPWRRELDWPYPEMVGSTISMITAHTDPGGDAFFRFPMFDGERHWGIYAASLERNDGPMKEISAVQHKNSSPTLEQFMSWHLDEPDRVERPHVVARREDLPRLRQKRHEAVFKQMWEKIESGNLPKCPWEGLQFAVAGDPLVAWRMKMELVGVAHIRARMTLLGRDYSDMYSPVGARPIAPWAENYDLIAGSGAFTPQEERLVRAFLIAMGHLYMAPDLMNWKYGGRNANFEADRVDTVGTVGVTFQGHPNSGKFVAHAIELMEQSLDTYCTPGSGKWYENPACYYLQASSCRMNLLFHLGNAGMFDPTRLRKLKDFLRWGILVLTAPLPHDYDLMRDGCDDAAYRAATKVRRMPPIGDHARLGTWVPGHYAMASGLFRKSDPAFADELLWAYQAGGSDGGYFNSLPLLFSRMEAADLAPAPAQGLPSRRLEGFGGVFRGRFGAPDEFYLLFKQGPGGYRFHRTEGSILLFADGKPLIYDGGEAGETWRHSTLSFYDVHMPLAAGHVERFASLEALDFCQGVHPLALKPGQPIFLSDVCNHELVAEATRRYELAEPANARSVWWIKDEYLVMHDELNVDPAIPSHWHLQVVSDAHTGDWREGYRFRGRFGTDLQVLLPGQRFADEQIARQPILDYDRTPEESFAMRHLQLRGESPSHYLAVLRPLSGAKRELEAQAITQAGRTVGVRVHGQGIDDLLLMSRQGVRWADDASGVRFQGRYGAVLNREEDLTLVLLDGARLSRGEAQLESDGPAAQLTVQGDRAILSADGTGSCRARVRGTPMTLRLNGQRRQIAFQC